MRSSGDPAVPLSCERPGKSGGSCWTQCRISATRGGVHGYLRRPETPTPETAARHCEIGKSRKLTKETNGLPPV